MESISKIASGVTPIAPCIKIHITAQTKAPQSQNLYFEGSFFDFNQLYIFLILYSTQDFFIILLISKNHKTKKVLREVYYE